MHVENKRNTKQLEFSSITFNFTVIVIFLFAHRSNHNTRKVTQLKSRNRLDTSVVTIPDFAMRYVSRYLGHDAIRIAILVYRVSQSLDLQFVYDGGKIGVGGSVLIWKRNIVDKERITTD